MENNIEVAARIRPPIHSNHLTEDVCLYADPYAKEIVLANQMSFYVDYALPLGIDQNRLFDGIISPRIDYMLQGYDVSFIAYGHINSGKTFTMLGPGLHCASSETTYGIVPRSGREIFNKLSVYYQQFGLQFKVVVSFIEVCNEKVKDLLASYNSVSSSFNGNIGFETDEKGHTVMYGLAEIECRNVSEFFDCLRLGMACRQTMKTHLNLLSSLSHCVVIVKVKQKWSNNAGESEAISSQAMFVDLAGSEQSPIDSDQAHNNASVGMHYRSLGVISAIIASFSGQWLPSSPLTQSLLYPLLKDSLIGSIKTLLICCLSPSSSDYSETLNSLRLIHHILTLNKYSLSKDTNTTFGVNNDGCPENGNNDFSKNSSGLQFAASQWLKLVSNAEGLFNRLVDNNVPAEAREEIEQWLCLKQECEDCFQAEARTVIDNNNKNQNRTGITCLEIIEEVTETTDSKSKSDKSSDNGDSVLSTDSNGFSVSASDSREEERDKEFVEEGNNNISIDEEHQDVIDCMDLVNTETIFSKEVAFEQEYSLHNDYQKDVFLKKLNRLMNAFSSQTNEKIDCIINNNVHDKESIQLQAEAAVNKVETVIHTSSQVSRSRCLISRRKSILPHGMQILLNDLPHNHNTIDEDLIDKSEFSDGKSDDDCEYTTADAAVGESKSRERLIGSASPEKAFHLLATSNCIKQTQLGLANLDFEAVSKRVEKLQAMIKIKEQFIQEMIKNSGTRILAKAKFQRKHVRLEEDYQKVKLQLSKAEGALSHKAGDTALEDQVEKYTILASQYEKRLQDIEMIKQIAGDSAKKVLELENSLHSSRRKMQKLKKQLKKEEDHKYCLETEIIEDEKRIKLLEEKCTIRMRGKSDTLSAIGCDSNEFQPASAEDGELQLLLPENRQILSCKKNVAEGLLLVSARLSHLEQLLNDNSVVFQEKGDLRTKEGLRHEIRNLRKTRDCLLEERKHLDGKMIQERVLTAAEERKLIECDEAIEAIDATIEYKNELICERRGLVALIENVQHEKGEEMLLLRLMKLSTVEMQILLYKYFRKVVDLRENGRKMETQITELDRHAETQAWKIQALSNALQQAHLESERRLIAVQKEHQEKLHLIFRHFADETSGHSSGADDTEKCRRQNKALKQRVLELEAMLYKARGSENSKSEMVDVVPARPPSNIPHHNLRQLGGAALAQHTTKVTRQKNKLIIQQHKTDKPSK